MQMSLGESLRLTLFGTSHGPRVGAYLEGIPAGIPIDKAALQAAMDERKPGGRYASKRKEPDNVELLSGVKELTTTGELIEISIKNSDVRSKDYSFLPNQPRPGHQDMVMMKKTDGKADLRGGGTSSARLTAPIVAAASLVSPIIDRLNIEVSAHVSAIGNLRAQPISQCPAKWINEECRAIRCQDPDSAAKMIALVEQNRMNQDSIGSEVELRVSGMPIGIGEPWFDGLEPYLARAMMSIPAARGVAFGEGFTAIEMTGSEHNSPWGGDKENPVLLGDKPDGALAGLSTGADLLCKIAFKPPSSIPREQVTLNLATNQQESLTVKGRHDPVLAPRAVAVVEAMAKFALADLAIRGGFYSE
ncbi:MAG: chorismate synthase [Candidatus Thermoplasmatota archaeon]|nr:chorismate synthase [Candidatus Thermoplasmatota archaeon]MEC8258617.1 chorismate synthase [Candidatus Thermoplasmatota archaeon]MEC8313248.1 chorismate synthase [Candidatus Thermoplasmatota archaeon]MEC8352737.1 chorismate synthase [Candidatus Thermoplasmatota archaeon]